MQRSYVAHGSEAGSCRLEDPLCGVASQERAALQVADASHDVRFATSPWVDGRLDRVRMDASAPLVTPDGWMIGTLCVLDGRSGRLGEPVPGRPLSPR